jgi:phosphate transport system substrate-binding protein
MREAARSLYWRELNFLTTRVPAVKKIPQILTLFLMVALIGGGTARAQLLINGAGATFPYPIYSKWFDEYVKVDPSVRFNYQSIGSGGGIKALRDKTVAFGASDAPLSDAQLAQMPAPVLHFPSVMGAVVLAYNEPNVHQQLKLTGPVIADIFLGKVVKWSDPEIAALNPGLKLPDDQIVTVHRSDGSGTSYIFSDYLSKVSPEWSAKVGKGTSLKWPVGLGGKGNEGVTAVVQQTAGAIGYVELIYALTNKIPFALLQNHDGAWINASLSGVTAAAATATIPDDFRVSITDAPGAASYPISSFTYLLVYKTQTDKAKGEAITKFLKWALSDGQKDANGLNYAPLPDAVVAKEVKQIDAISLPAQ